MDPFTDLRYSAASTSLSEDDNEPGSSNKATKRGSRGTRLLLLSQTLFPDLCPAFFPACDRCRKIKSKCEPTDGEKCKNCLVSGTGKWLYYVLPRVLHSDSIRMHISRFVQHESCYMVIVSYMWHAGPSFKRGPPKGYIHAIEQRWQQVECILATVMSTPRAEGIMTDLRQDAFARSVLDRVASGPYVCNILIDPTRNLIPELGPAGAPPTRTRYLSARLLRCNHGCRAWVNIRRPAF